MSIKSLLKVAAMSVPITLAAGSFSLIALEGTASAAGVQQSATIDPTNGGAQTVTSGTPFSSGQLVTVNVPANSSNGGTGELAANTNYTIWECSDPGGTVANLPTTVASCDSDTSEGTNGTTNSDGSVSYSGYEVYVLPNTESAGNGGLGENASHTPVCNLGNPCVLAVLTDADNFSDPSGLAFTQPFVIKGTNDSGANPGDGTPEAPLMIGLPLVGAAAIVGLLLVRRRKDTKAAQVHAA